MTWEKITHNLQNQGVGKNHTLMKPASDAFEIRVTPTSKWEMNSRIIVENIMSLISQMSGNDQSTARSARILQIAALTAGFLIATATVAPAKDYDGNPPGPRGGPGTNWENPPGPVGGPGASPDSRWTRAQWRRNCAKHPRACRRALRHHDFDNNPPGPVGGPGTNWENPPGPVGGPGASPDRRGWRRPVVRHLHRKAHRIHRRMHRHIRRHH